ncbi:MAG: hypothetical protein ACRDRO_26005 [Pseudonocardiaceae bacterium]
MQRLTCRPCDQDSDEPRGNPSQVYACPECGCGWNNDPWGRHGHHIATAHALAVNAAVIAWTWILADRGWGFLPVMVTLAGFLFALQVGSWIRSWIENVYDPPEDTQ